MPFNCTVSYPPAFLSFLSIHLLFFLSFLSTCFSSFLFYIGLLLLLLPCACPISAHAPTWLLPLPFSCPTPVPFMLLPCSYAAPVPAQLMLPPMKFCLLLARVLPGSSYATALLLPCPSSGSPLFNSRHHQRLTTFFQHGESRLLW